MDSDIIRQLDHLIEQTYRETGALPQSITLSRDAWQEFQDAISAYMTVPCEGWPSTYRSVPLQRAEPTPHPVRFVIGMTELQALKALRYG